MTLSDFIMTRPINDGHRGLVLVVCFCPSVRLSVCLFQTSKKCSKLAHIRVSGGENLRSGGQRSISRGQITLTVTYTDRSPKNQHFDIMLLTGLYGVFCRDGDSQDHKVDSRDFEIWDLLATCHWRLKTYTWNLGPMTRDLIETGHQWLETWLETWFQWFETCLATAELVVTLILCLAYCGCATFSIENHVLGISKEDNGRTSQMYTTQVTVVESQVIDAKCQKL